MPLNAAYNMTSEKKVCLIEHQDIPSHTDLNVVAGVVMALTATKVKSISEAGRYTDSKGLALLVTKTLNKTWVYRYQLNKRRRDMGLGKYPVISLSEARELRDSAAKLVAAGIDPIDDRNNKHDPVNRDFRFLSKEFIEFKSPEWKNAKHAKQWTNTLETYAMPFIGNLQVEHITTKIIRDMLVPIWTKKPETATRVRSRVENIIDYAIALGESDKANPASLKVVSKILPKNPKHERVIHFKSLPYKDIPEFWLELSKHQSTNANALRFLILTASRTSEAIGAQHEEIEGDVWILPKERMKSKREHRVPMTEGLKEWLNTLPRMNEYLFPSVSYQAKPISNMAMLNLIKKTMHKDFTVHGFRASFKTWAEEQTNFDSNIIEASLAHVIKDKTEAAYMRGDLLEKRRLLMNAWYEFVTNKCTEK